MIEAEIKPASRFPFVVVGDLEFHDPEYLIDELLETDTLGLIFGDPASGKSFVAVDMALSVATGADYHDRPTKQGAVFFIAGEGHNGLARRFNAWAKAHGEKLEGVPLFKSARAAQFLDKQSAAQVSDAVADLAKVHGNPVLIIIDTLARNFGSGDENSTKDMNDFVSAIDKLKANFPNCVVLIVHHCGHGEKQRARGSMALKAALDCEYRVEKTDETLTLTCTKMKDAVEPSPAFFEFRDVQLGDDAQSAVLIQTDAPERREKQPSKTQRLALDTFIEAAAKLGMFTGEEFTGLHLDEWQASFLASHTGDNMDSKKRAFRRARQDLVTARQLNVRDDVYSTDNPKILDDIIASRTSRT
jgi:hypothetical protein